MRFATAFSLLEHVDLAAADRTVGNLLDQFDTSIDLAFVFFTFHLREMAEDFVPRLPQRLGTQQILGCTAESIIANQLEIHQQPAMVIWAASLPGVSIETAHLQYQRLGHDAALTGWPESLLGSWPQDCAMLALSDPFSFPMEELLTRINEDRGAVPVMGGMSSGGGAPGQCRLFLGEHIVDNGAVIAHVSGAVQVRPILSQGCRPIGSPMVITRAERNEICELGGTAALEQINAIFRTLPTREQQLVNSGLHVGRVINEYQDRFVPGDFLIRNVIGVNEESGSIAIADYVKAGQTIQFHIRDHESAHADLKEMLNQAAGATQKLPQAGLMFSCNGRGTRLFPQEHHDAGLLQQLLGPIPLAGFFAAGEIGPVGNQNFVHGFTASVALFEER